MPLPPAPLLLDTVEIIGMCTGVSAFKPSPLPLFLTYGGPFAGNDKVDT